MRITDHIGVDAVAVWMPPERETTAERLAAGHIDAADAASCGAVEVPVAAGISAPDMAVAAARDALAAAGRDAAEVDLVIHGWVYHQGHDFWSPAHYIADQLGAHRAVPFGVQQMCHGGAMALQVGAARLLADAEVSTVLVTTADRFVGPGFDRWRSDLQVVFGDAGTAAVLSRSPRGLALVAHRTAALSAVESMYRGDDPFSPAPLSHSTPIDARRTKRAFLAAGGMERFARAAPETLRRLTLAALDDAGLEADDPRIRCAVVSRLGPRTIDLTYLPVLEDLLKADVVGFGQRTGHLGCGDALANLADLTAHDVLAPGEYALIYSGGGGFTWSCLIVRRPAAVPAHTRPLEAHR